jgi:LmbE family N-acetylglucosaminyl deacetylase
MRHSGGVLGIFAHPDDETIVAGGTLAACAHAGYQVALLCLTRGEQGPIAHPDLATRQTLGAVRAAELKAAAAALGVEERAVECLGYPDGELEWVDEALVVDDIAHRIQAQQPDAVITFGPEGLYWHRDHIAVYRYTISALDRLGAEGFSTDLYFASWPQGLIGHLEDRMAAREHAIELWGLSATDFGVPAESITTVVDVRRFLAQKLRALRSHRTQLTEGHLFQIIPDDLAEEFFGREYFTRASDGPCHWLDRALGGTATGQANCQTTQ